MFGGKLGGINIYIANQISTTFFPESSITLGLLSKIELIPPNGVRLTYCGSESKPDPVL